MRTVFFGTSSFAVPALGALAASEDLLTVVTQPDRPAGRGLALRATPITNRARELGLEVLAPARLDERFVEQIAALRPQLLSCASYGKILPKRLLEIPGMTALNVHPSLLPEYRGATPMQAALRDGRARTGVTVFWMAAEMDAGDVALQRDVEILPDDDYGSLHDRLALAGAELLSEAAELVKAGSLPRTPQDRARATYTRPIRKDDLKIPEGEAAQRIVDLVRSASPSPAAWTTFGGKRLKVLRARAEPPGDLTTDEGPAIVAADGLVRLLRVVPEGRREMSGAEFVRSMPERR